MSEYYRIVGLKSAKGQKLNGHACTVHSDRTGERLSCWIDGEPEMVAIKRENLKLLPTHHTVVTLTVKRDSIRSPRGYDLYIEKPCYPPGGLPLSRLDEWVYEEFRNERSTPRGLGFYCAFCFNEHFDDVEGALLIRCDDLNFCRAINMIASGKSAKWGSDALGGDTWETICCFIQDYNGMVLAKFTTRSPGVAPECPLNSTGRGTHRANIQRLVHIYPCALEDHFDALEVRYHDINDTQSFQEIYHDYGPDEACMLYIANIADNGESYRLDPQVMAAVDPQAFWRAILHCDAFIQYLERCRPLVDSKVVENWQEMRERVQDCHERKAGFVSECGLDPSRLLPTNGVWSIKTTKEHREISMQNAIFAVCLISGLGFERIELLEQYYGTKLEIAMHLAYRKFGDGPWELFEDETNEEKKWLTICAYCKNCPDELQQCTGCDILAYCGPACQKADWPVHRRLCRGRKTTNKKKDKKAKASKKKSKQVS